MSDLIERHPDWRKKQWQQLAKLNAESLNKTEAKVSKLADALEQATDDLRKANARERPAFMAGAKAAINWDGIETFDYEQVWQQYRCQDDADWYARAVSKVLQ